MSTRPWVATYEEGVPATLAPYADEMPGRSRPTVRAGEARCAALQCECAGTTYETLLREGEAFGAALERRSIGRGDRVALVLPNCAQSVIGELGAWMAGAIVAPVNATYPDQELAGLLTHAGAETLVTLAPFYDRVKAVQPRTSVTSSSPMSVMPPRLKGCSSSGSRSLRGDTLHTRCLDGGGAADGLGRIDRVVGVSRIFLLVVAFYASIVVLTLFKTAPGLGHHALAAMPLMTVTLPTSAVLMIMSSLLPSNSSGVGLAISIAVVSAVVNIGIAYLIWHAGRENSDR